LPGSHEQVYVGHSRAYDNPGIATATSNTGSGIVLSGVNGGKVERSVAHGNGRLCATVGGPVGIWTYDSNAVVIQHNESYGNHTASSADGGGFDLDQNVSNSILQYNYSHDNDGAGYLLAHAPANDVHRGNVVRYNISQNDGRKNSYAGIEVWGRTIDTDIYNNTVFVSPAVSGTPSAVRVWNSGIPDRRVSGLRIRNNILITSGGLPVVKVAATQASATDVRFEGNNYYASGSTLRLVWGASTYNSVAAWRVSGEETIAGVATGFSVNPQLNAAGAGVTLDDADRLETIDAYRLRDGSPMVDAGIDLSARFGISTGASDFYGTGLPNGGGYDIGAHERTPTGNDEIVLFTADATSLAGAWRRVADATAARGLRLVHPNAGAPKLTAALASPVNYFELTFVADAGKGYRLWLRGKAESNVWSNDSVFVQFSDSVNVSGASLWRTGTTSATIMNLEDCDGCGLSGWGWQDNGWGTGVLGPLVRFSHTGVHTVRVQTREDGLSIDQIVLSAGDYLSRAPGSLKNDSTILTPTSSATPAPDAVLYAADIQSTNIHGGWTLVADVSAANGVALANPDRGAAKITTALASPASFVDVAFNAQGGVPYQVWLRMRADRNATSNDSVYLQFSGAIDASGNPVARIGTAAGAAVVLQDSTGAPIAGWGWNDAGWAGLASPFVFSQTGPQTLRIQQREDGIFIDQIVISPARYLTKAPGALINDTTIVQR
jgi:Right handed beta helix region